MAATVRELHVKALATHDDCQQRALVSPLFGQLPPLVQIDA
jgi:hypothetical protein